MLAAGLNPWTRTRWLVRTWFGGIYISLLDNPFEEYVLTNLKMLILDVPLKMYTKATGISLSEISEVSTAFEAPCHHHIDKHGRVSKFLQPSHVISLFIFSGEIDRNFVPHTDGLAKTTLAIILSVELARYLVYN